MLTVHHLNNCARSASCGCLKNWASNTNQKVRATRRRRAPAALFKVHPLGKSPVVTDGNVTVAESGAIIEYLIETYGEGRF